MDKSSLSSNILFLILSSIFMLSCSSQEKNICITKLHKDWKFKNTEESNWNNANVPGEVHMDLFRLGEIPDPFVANNELDLQWIAEKDWEYKTTFTVDEKLLSKKNLEIKFECLDTYAKVTLNGQEILTANNAFRSFEVDVSDNLKAKNELHILFENPFKKEQAEMDKLPYKLPVEHRVFTRKPQFHYGWDWGPTLTTVGISDDIELVAWDDLKIHDVYIKQVSLDESLAQMQADIEIRSDLKQRVQVEVYVNGQLVVSQDHKANTEMFSIPFSITNPKRWWPHTMGKPYLYDIRIVIKKSNGEMLDEYELRKGFRTMELITEKDKDGETFYFEVNGKPIYAKGANYIPQHVFQSKVTMEDYGQLIDDVLSANMNMLRVWGGGIYERDEFYELCDEKGIMVWQDFMFACAMYPGDEAFLENVKLEAEEQIKRLRNHSSIALWCGNNENSEGWHRWGWQANRTEKEKEEIWNNYLKLFDQLLPQLVNEHHDDIDYWESSPRFGRGNPQYKVEGDAHDWYIWHDEYPFEHLIENVPRFMSEFGFQSFPNYQTIQYINGNNSNSLKTKAFKTHQKHPRGYSIIKNYMERDYPVPQNDEDYVYVSQLVQAYGIVMGIEAQRRAKPYNMGTLYWQLNDCWPAVSWSSIDYAKQWKVLHYKIKNAYENLLISTNKRANELDIYIVNDDFKEYEGELKVEVMNFQGELINNETKQVKVEANSSDVKFILDISTYYKSGVFVVSSFNGIRQVTFLENHKSLVLPRETIHREVTKTKTGFRIELSSDVLQKDVFLYSDIPGNFSDNFFDLLPGDKKVVLIESDEAELKNFNVKSFNDL